MKEVKVVNVFTRLAAVVLKQNAHKEQVEKKTNLFCYFSPGLRALFSKAAGLILRLDPALNAHIFSHAHTQPAGTLSI